MNAPSDAGGHRLEWWCRGDDPDLHWALGNRGRRVGSRDSASGRWSVSFRKGPREELLGVVASLTEAKTLAESTLSRTLNTDQRRRPAEAALG